LGGGIVSNIVVVNYHNNIVNYHIG
jgi:hypothetical protein